MRRSMGKRRKARESALQILYQLEFDISPVDQAIDLFWQKKKAPEETKEYSRWLVEGIVSRQNAVDEAIQSISEHWRISRMTLVDRNILRLAAFELLHAENIAPAIIINEAIEIAKRFSGPEGATFVNGILDALRKKIEAEKRPALEVRNVRAKSPEEKSKTSSRAKKV
jgi:N utilization substance protein B